MRAVALPGPDALRPEADEWLALLGGPPLLPSELTLLGELVRLRRVPAGGLIFGHDDPARCLVAVRAGRAALGWRGGDGGFQVERPVHGPGWLDLASCWLQTGHPMDARATTEVVLAELPGDALRQRLDVHPGLAERLLVALARQVNSLTLATHGLMRKDAPARFAQWLLQRADEASVVRLTERKRDVASQLAITPETLSRLMRTLSEQGTIAVVGYTVSLLDRAALERVAGD